VRGRGDIKENESTGSSSAMTVELGKQKSGDNLRLLLLRRHSLAKSNAVCLETAMESLLMREEVDGAVDGRDKGILGGFPTRIIDSCDWLFPAVLHDSDSSVTTLLELAEESSRRGTLPLIEQEQSSQSSSALSVMESRGEGVGWLLLSKDRLLILSLRVGVYSLFDFVLDAEIYVLSTGGGGKYTITGNDDNTSPLI